MEILINNCIQLYIEKFINSISENFGADINMLWKIWDKNHKKVRNKRTKYNKILLDLFCKENKISLIGDYSGKINSKSLITGNCVTEDCTGKFAKKFTNLIDTGGYCKKCTIIQRAKKIQTTSLKKYGTLWPIQSSIIRDKIENTNISRYGTKCTLQDPEVDEKSRATCREKYGHDYPAQSEDIKNKTQTTNMEKYGQKCTLQNPEIDEKAKATKLEKYGTIYPIQNPEIKAKVEKTFIEKYGQYPISLPENKAKAEQSNMEKYGTKNALESEAGRAKMRQTTKERYGYEYAMQSPEIKQQMRENSMEKYGVPYPRQHPDIARKAKISSLSSKEYVFPSGKKILIQGYENMALDELIKSYTEEDIITGDDIPIIPYTDEHGKDRIYYPDIYLKSINKIIEVKSSYSITFVNAHIIPKMTATTGL